MFRMLMIRFVLPGLPLMSFALESFRLEIQPFDFQTDGGESYFSGIGQIESNGKHLFLRGAQEPIIIELDAHARVVRKIGGSGDHPAEFGQVGVMALAVKGEELWGIDLELKRVRQFFGDEYRKSFRLDSFNISYGAGLANIFAFSDEYVVIPARAETKHLAAVYLHDGTLIQHIGEPIAFPELSERIIGINNTHWLALKDGWLSVHKFFPLVTVYDTGFTLIDQFPVESAIITDMVDRTMSFDPGEQYTLPAPVFSDAKLFRGDLFLMCQGFLHQLDLKTHALESITRFFGEGDDFKEVQAPQLVFYFFAFLDSGQFVLGHPAMLWNHDLWTADLPFLSKAGPG